ncbi:MAG: HAD family hydrolase [Opitutales bacterium]
MFQLDRPDKAYAAYIFDCDGTLAHSMPLHLRAWNDGLEAAGAPFRLARENFMSVAGMALRQTVDHWNETHSLQIDHDTAINAKNRFFSAHMHEIEPLQPTVDYARELAAAAVPLAVASGGHREDVEATLRIIGVSDLFPVVVTADDVERAKPAPDLFLLAAERLGVKPEDCCVLEDSELGIQAAEACGMGWIRIPVLL